MNERASCLYERRANVRTHMGRLIIPRDVIDHYASRNHMNASHWMTLAQAIEACAWAIDNDDNPHAEYVRWCAIEASASHGRIARMSARGQETNA